MQEKIQLLHQMLKESENIVFFGGAGVSTESGIPDFRSVDGLYHQKYQFPPETILSHDFFFSHTAGFYEFYQEKMLCLTAKPNEAHKRLAWLEQIGKLTSVITQNIDGLHQLAGSKVVRELHGSIHRNTCLSCRKIYDAQYMLRSRGIPRCECGGIIKPDVVLYGEGLDDKTVEQSVRDITKADMLIVGGTSLAVYPAAGLLSYFKGNYLVVINKDSTPMDEHADLLIQGKIGEILSEIEF